MGRYRMLSENYWTDPDLSDLTSEQRLALLLFLTNNDSNVIGVYRTQWRSLGSGPGWTEPQLLSVARDLVKKGSIVIDEATGWVWVKEWWKHNKFRGAFAGNVSGKARAELSKVPEQWAEAILEWLEANDEDGTLESLGSPFEGASKGLASPIQGPGSNLTVTTTSISTSTPNPIGDGGDGGGGECLDLELLVDAAVWTTARVKVIKNESAFRHKVRTRISTSGANQADYQALAAWQSAQADARSSEQERQRLVAQKARAAQEVAVEQARVEETFASLPPERQDEIMTALGAHLAASSPATHAIFKKSGIQSKMVRVALAGFMKDLLSLNSEAVAT